MKYYNCKKIIVGCLLCMMWIFYYLCFVFYNDAKFFLVIMLVFFTGISLMYTIKDDL